MEFTLADTMNSNSTKNLTLEQLAVLETVTADSRLKNVDEATRLKAVPLILAQLSRRTNNKGLPGPTPTQTLDTQSLPTGEYSKILLNTIRYLAQHTDSDSASSQLFSYQSDYRGGQEPDSYLILNEEQLAQQQLELANAIAVANLQLKRMRIAYTIAQCRALARDIQRLYQRLCASISSTLTLAENYSQLKKLEHLAKAIAFEAAFAEESLTRYLLRLVQQRIPQYSSSQEMIKRLLNLPLSKFLLLADRIGTYPNTITEQLLSLIAKEVLTILDGDPLDADELQDEFLSLENTLRSRLISTGPFQVKRRIT